MRKLVLAYSFILSFVLIMSGNLLAQSHSYSAKPVPSTFAGASSAEGLRPKHVTPISVPRAPLSSLVAVPNAVDMGVTGKWHDQSNGGALHRMQVDPSNPNNVHAVIMSAFGVTDADTTTDNFVPMRRVYYVFSSDAGVTWSTPKSVSSTRAGYPSIVLINRNGTYVPVIGLHRFESETVTDVFIALYIEKGAPGTGDFAEVDASRFTFEDEEADIIWPIMAVSKDGTKVYVIGSISSTTTAGLRPMQFGTLTLNETKDGGTWSGWKEGPEAGSDASKESGGECVLRVSESGKLGLVWRNALTEDLGLYISESTDEGATWGGADNFYYTTPTSTAADQEGNTYSLYATGDFDFIYIGEDPVVVFNGFYYVIFPDNTASTIPSATSMLYWRKGLAAPQILLSRYNTSELGDPLYPGDFLHDWQSKVGGGTIVGEDVLARPVIGRMGAPQKFTVYFEAWQQGDTAEVGYLLRDTPYVSLGFHSVYRMTTLDGGQSWSEPVPYLANASDAPVEQRLDYRFLNTSDWNPEGTIQTMFAADSSPGLHGDQGSAGEPGWSEVHWFSRRDAVAHAKKTSTPYFSLEQNYPNPVISGNRSIIPLTLARSEHLTVTITDVMGREIATIFSGQLGAGSHDVPFSTGSLAAGMYQYIVKTGDITLARSFTVVK